MQNEEIFIPLESFTVKQRYSPNFGIFYLTRQVFSIQAEGGRWYQKALFYAFFTLPLCVVALSLDVCTLLIYCAFLIVKKLTQILCAALMLLIETVIKKTLGVILLMLSICATLIFIYLKWPQIINFIDSLF